MHIHHEAAHRWFAAGVNPPGPLSDHRKRFGSDRQPSQLPESSGDVPAVLAILRQFCDGRPSLLERRCEHSQVAPTRCVHSQITDVFLLGLAIHKGGGWLFDQRISTAAVQGGGEALELIAP